MAAVSVFVDDAIRGDLPLVCAKTGEPADLWIRVRKPIGGMPAVMWLLVILGPVGFVPMLLMAMFWPGEQLTVRLPETEASFAHERQLQRLRLAALGAGVAFPVLGVVGVPMFSALCLALGLAFFVVAGGVTVVLWRQAITVEIDVTRRWVTLTNVHPNFVDAVERQDASPRR
jgi:hypothetical protein